MELVAGFIVDAVANIGNDAKLAAIKKDVNALMSRFPLYAHRLP
jgi:glycine hydroxymethyltransferase